MKSPVHVYNEARIAGMSHDDAMVQAVNELIQQVKDLQDRVKLLEGESAMKEEHKPHV